MRIFFFVAMSSRSQKTDEGLQKAFSKECQEKLQKKLHQ